MTHQVLREEGVPLMLRRQVQEDGGPGAIVQVHVHVEVEERRAVHPQQPRYQGRNVGRCDAFRGHIAAEFA